MIKVVSFALDNEILHRCHETYDWQLDPVSRSTLRLEGQLDVSVYHSVLEWLETDCHQVELAVFVDDALSVRFQPLRILVKHLGIVNLFTIPLTHHKVKPHVIQRQHDLSQEHLLNVVSVANLQAHRERNRVKV